MDFEQTLTAWAESKIRDGYGWGWQDQIEEVVIDEVAIEADPGNDRDDSYGESPSTNIVIRGRVNGRWVEERVTADLLAIVRELSGITKGGAR